MPVGSRGVSLRSQHHRASALTWTVVANTTDGAWPVADEVRQALGPLTA
jgi:hypothetical protein